MVGRPLYDINGIFQPSWFYGSVIPQVEIYGHIGYINMGPSTDPDALELPFPLLFALNSQKLGYILGSVLLDVFVNGCEKKIIDIFI